MTHTHTHTHTLVVAFVVAFVAVGVSAQTPVLNVPPPTPAAWPDGKGPIADNFLQDKLVTDAWAYVQSVVPAEVLNIAPSTAQGGATTKYNADAAANCYWPSGLCTRTNGTTYYQADISTCPGANQWGLTYDDGPTVVDAIDNGNDTPDIRAGLKTAGLKATFFVVGNQALSFGDELVNVEKDGNEIGVHTWTHSPLTSLTNQQIVGEIKYTESIIYQRIQKLPTLFRPPYGDV
ncbi:chitin deacetylase, partial [Borealophlyctis nickersoniae]